MIEAICTPYGKAAFSTVVKCDECGEIIGFCGTMSDKEHHYCNKCSTSANQEFRVCQQCSLPMIDGMTDLDSFYCHEGCFEQAMADVFGQWREVDDDGFNGYYEWYDAREQSWQGTGIFYTTWY